MAKRDYTADELSRLLNTPVDKLKLWLRDEGVTPVNSEVEKDESLHRYAYDDEEIELLRTRLHGGV